MPVIFREDADAEEAIDTAEEALARGALIVLPTDTVYGVAARPDLPEATERLFEAKRRPRDLTLPVLVAGTADAESVAVLDDRALTLAHQFWPGGLTIVLPRSGTAKEWDLGAARETVGVRVPAHGLAIALLARTGPLAVSSANLSGEPTPAECGGLQGAFGSDVDVYLCVGLSNGDRPSTIVDLTETEPRFLRAGVIPPDDILVALKG